MFKRFRTASLAALVAVTAAWASGQEEEAGAREVTTGSAVGERSQWDQTSTESLGGAPPAALAPAPDPARLAFIPPLSIEDAIALAARAEGLLLDEAGPSTAPATGAAVGAMIGSARSYMEFLDNRHSTLGAYRWFRLATQKAPATGEVEDKARLPGPIRNVSAIAFEASRGDVWLHSLTVVDRGEPVVIPVELTISQDLPWTVVRYLPEPMTVREIATRRRTWGRKAELTLFAGISSQPDHARRAIAQMQRAELALARGEPQTAAAALRRARERMQSFREERFAAADEAP